MPSDLETRASLILRLPDAADVEAWNEFTSLYGPLMYRLARRRGLQAADAEDLVQEVFTAVSRSVERWLARKDRGRFRAWLFRIARNRAINFLTRPKHRPQAAGGADAANQLAAVVSPDVAADVFDMEYRRELFRRAAEQVRRSVADNTWRAFWLSSVEALGVAETAKRLGMSVGSVYIARSRTMARLRAIVREFEERQS
ncbi:MAG: sigma-70 family RNA polymerase sigma factor [Pirellulaceae bacterium]